jgi:hypothetical protein
MDPRDAANRDLIFGLLALQNARVSRDQLVAVFGAWSAAPGRSMADLLVEQRAFTPPRRALLDALAAEHVAVHGGEPRLARRRILHWGPPSAAPAARTSSPH